MSIERGTHLSTIVNLLCEYGSLTPAELVDKSAMASQGYTNSLLHMLMNDGTVERFRLPRQPSRRASQYFYRLTREELEMRG